MKLITRPAAFAAFTLAIAQAAPAALVTPTGVSGNGPATTTDVVGSGIGAIIDGSGLSAPLASDESNALGVTHTGIFGSTGASAHWITNAPNGGSVSYFPNAAGNPELTFSFAGVESFGSLYLWGYTGQGFAAGGNTPSDIQVEFFVGAVSQGVLNLTAPTLNDIGNGDYQGSDTGAGLVGFGQAYSADSIVVTILATHGDGTTTSGDADPSNDNVSGGDRVGVAEIAFSDVVRPVPEPGSIALLALGGLLYARRRRSA